MVTIASDFLLDSEPWCSYICIIVPIKQFYIHKFLARSSSIYPSQWTGILFLSLIMIDGPYDLSFSLCCHFLVWFLYALMELLTLGYIKSMEQGKEEKTSKTKPRESWSFSLCYTVKGHSIHMLCVFWPISSHHLIIWAI